MVKRPHQHFMGQGEESFQSVTCNGTENQTPCFYGSATPPHPKEAGPHVALPIFWNPYLRRYRLS